MKIVYIIGPYTGNTWDEVEKNIEKASGASLQLWNMGYGVYCPHLNTAHFETMCKATYGDFLEFNLLMLCGADMALVLQGWGNSQGSKIEIYSAEVLGIPVYYSIEGLVSGDPPSQDKV